MIYLFGLMRATDEPSTSVFANLPNTIGEVSCRRVGDFVAITGWHDDDEILPKRRLLLSHARTLETLMSHGTVLPARFGLLIDSLTDFEDLLRQQATHIAKEFDRLCGCVELGVRVRFDRQAALEQTLAEDRNLQLRRDMLAQKGPEAHFERAEFGKAMAEHLDRRRGAAQAAILARLKTTSRSYVLRAPEEDVEVLRVEFLVEDALQGAFANLVEAAASECGFAGSAEPDIRIVGPVPVYNFVNMSLNPASTEEAAA